MSSRRLYLSSDVTQASMQALVEKILSYERDDYALQQQAQARGGEYTPEPIHLYIDSYGGEVYACFGLLSVMNACTTPIRTIVTGCAMSCGFLIAIHGHERYAYPEATLMYHQISSYPGYDSVKALSESLTQSLQLQERLESMTLKKTKLTKAMLKKVRETKTDLYLDAKKAQRLGCVDTICQGNIL